MGMMSTDVYPGPHGLGLIEGCCPDATSGPNSGTGIPGRMAWASLKGRANQAQRLVG